VTAVVVGSAQFSPLFLQDGYGFDINSGPACVLVKDVLDNFEAVAKVSSQAALNATCKSFA
jgi:hypothetical protein